MEMKQKKFSNQTKLEFFDEELKYTIRDKSATADFRISYAQFPVSSNLFEERNEWLRNVGLLWVALGVFILGSAIVADESIRGKGFWILIGGICLLAYKFSATKYSVFPTENGKIFIIQDKQHDAIIAEINKRKKEQLLARHGEIDRGNDPDHEIAKFIWLKEQGVLSSEEAEKKIEQIKWSLQS